MERHARALGIKVLAIVIFTSVLTPMFTDLPASNGLFIGLALSVIAYALGDLVILPVSNNTVATVADIITAAIVYWAGVRLLGGTGLSMGELVFFSLVVGVSEWFLHKYMARFVLANKQGAEE
ncbi:MAG: DUF2512 family protein [Bacillota bacterium]